MKPYTLHVLMIEETAGNWSAQVPEFDSVASGASEQEALDRVPGLIATFREAARRYGAQSQIWRSAPPEDWDRYLRATPGACPRR